MENVAAYIAACDKHGLEWTIKDDTMYVSAVSLQNRLKLTHIHATLSKYSNDCKERLVRQTKGGPQTCTFITIDAARRLIANSRKPWALDLLKDFAIEPIAAVSMETDAVAFLMNAFPNERFVHQYRVGSYFVDAYLPVHNIAIECDEPYHAYNADKDAQRQCQILKLLPPGAQIVRHRPCIDGPMGLARIVSVIHEAIVNHETKEIEQVNPTTGEVVKVHSSIAHVQTSMRVARKSLMEAIELQRVCKGFLWRYLVAPTSEKEPGHCQEHGPAETT